MMVPNINTIAQWAHESNRAYCRSIGDNSQLPWDEAPQWQRDSAITGVKTIIKDPSTTAERLHECWMAAKIADGWVFGPVKDAENKVHPCIVPYEKLPVSQRAKDHIFGAVARAGITILGFNACLHEANNSEI